MNWYRGDLHIHSVLSPCGDLDMSPSLIIQVAKSKNLDIIGITDHNSTYHTEVMIELGKKAGLSVFPGVEINTREEVHCLAFFENTEITKQFQEYINIHLPNIKNKPEKFGEQLVVNEHEEILQEIDNLLISGLMASIEEIEKKVHELNGIFIPAHVDRISNGIFSQLGFIPQTLNIDAIEISPSAKKDNFLSKRKNLEKYTIITNSDAHFTEQIAKVYTEYYLLEPTFNEWKMALNSIKGRKVRL